MSICQLRSLYDVLYFFVAGYIGANLADPVFQPQSPPTLGFGFSEIVV